MYKTITYSEDEYYCRYLNIAINSEPVFDLCKGRFYSFLSEKLNIKKLPYNLKLLDLILEGCISPDLFVQLPITYFNSWTNYPVLEPVNGSHDKDIAYYNLIIIPRDETQLSDFCHPYDAKLKKSFIKKFSTLLPKSLTKYKHPNGRSFYPNELYLSYWKGYVILETLCECKFIDRYLSKGEGSVIFKNKLKKNNVKWNSKYASIFNAISHYRTFTSLHHFSNSKIQCTYGDISEHLLAISKIEISELESGLELLLQLHKDWTRKWESDGLLEFNFSLKSLKRDIYFLFEWLCSAGYNERDLFNKWQYKNRQPASWSQLKNVLDFEEIDFEDCFKRYVPIYSKKVEDWVSLDGLSNTYNKLSKYKSFEPWIRSFSDLHKSINMKGDIKLNQPRLLDNLLIITIRTEVLIRAICSKVIGENEPDDLNNIFLKLAENLTDNKAKSIFITVSDNSKLTKLQNRPERVFKEIEENTIGKKWSDEQKYFFKSILKFITSRNYFAHHYYKDHEFDTHTNELCGDILTSCLHTILFVIEATNGH